MKPRHYLQKLGEDLDSRSQRKQFVQMLKEDGRDILSSMGRPDEPANETHLAKAMAMMRRKWEFIGIKRGRALDETIWEEFEKSFKEGPLDEGN